MAKRTRKPQTAAEEVAKNVAAEAKTQTEGEVATLEAELPDVSSSFPENFPEVQSDPTHQTFPANFYTDPGEDCVRQDEVEEPNNSEPTKAPEGVEQAEEAEEDNPQADLDAMFGEAAKEVPAATTRQRAARVSRSSQGNAGGNTNALRKLVFDDPNMKVKTILEELEKQGISTMSKNTVSAYRSIFLADRDFFLNRGHHIKAPTTKEEKLALIERFQMEVDDEENAAITD